MNHLSSRLTRFAVLAGLALTVGSVQAHTGHGTTGIAAGLAHPLGADHLLAMIAVGVWSVMALPADKTWWGPATFMLSLTLAAALGAAGVTVPMLEQMISLSVVLFGAMLVLHRQKMPLHWSLILVALAAALHGFAHGAEAPASGFTSYALGFLATTAALHFGGVLLGLGTRRYLAEKAQWLMGALGATFGTAGLYLLTQV